MSYDIYFLNLESSTDRRAYMEEQLSAHAGNVFRVQATTCEDLQCNASLAARAREQTVGAWLDALDPSTRCRTIACWLSHVLLLERLQRSQAELSLILEDDVVFEVGWEARLQDALRDAPPGWSVLKVCAWGNTRESDRVSDNWFAMRGPIFEDNQAYYAGSCGYFVRRDSVDMMLAYVQSQAITDIDAAMLAIMGAAMGAAPDAYAAYQYENALHPGGFSSTIRGISGHAYAAGYAAGSSSLNSTPQAVVCDEMYDYQ